MNTYDREYLAKHYSHIYVEEAAYKYPLTQQILEKFKSSTIITIKHYKDMFNRSRQDFLLQKKAPSLILAVNNSELLYPGARFCQSFGNANFYYTSNVMNCIYDCEYCYLQGMYPSGNMVVFVNVEDYFSEVSQKLKEHSMYICISYDTDLLAIEGMTGITKQWIDFAATNPDLTIEIRTKSAYMIDRLNNSNLKNVIFAWTLSPDFITQYEHLTPSLDARLKAVSVAIENGSTVRLCFDPMIYVPNYKDIYSDFYHKVFTQIHGDKIFDLSIGVFRISSDYLKSMRKKRHCAITAYPYENIDGMCSYEQKKSDEMLDFARLELSKYISSDKIFGL